MRAFQTDLYGAISAAVRQITLWYDTVATTVTDPRRIGNPDDPLYRELLWDGDPWNLRNDEDVGPWIATLAALVDCDRPPDELETRVEMGPSIDQQPLAASIEMACD